MIFSAQNFDDKFTQWQEWQSMPWNRLLYSVGRRNLLRHIGERPLHIIDVGGGNGADSLYLAGLGHQVTLVDFSAAMLADAQAKAAQEDLVERITFHQADAAALPGLFSVPTFDLALCHNMLHFVADPRALLRNICATLQPGGLLSLIDTNRYSETLRLAIQTGDLSAALDALNKVRRMHTWFNVPEWRHTAEEMIAELHLLDCTLVAQYGLRCICDYLPNEHKSEPEYYARLEHLEEALTGAFPYYLLARFFQVIVRKTN